MEDHLDARYRTDCSKHGTTLFHGDLAILRRNSSIDKMMKMTSSELNSILGTEVDWRGYEIEENLDEKLCVLFLLIYRILDEGMHMVIYNQEFMRALDPETMVSMIDISSKGPRETPMHTHHRLNGDTLYHFIRVGECRTEHDTTLLDRIGNDEQCREYPRIGYAPHSEITVKELIECAGNYPTIITIHDYRECMDAAASVPEDEDNASWNCRSRFPGTLEMILSPELIGERMESGFTDIPMTSGESRYSDNLVQLYRLCCSPTRSILCYNGVGDVEPEYDQICLSIFIDVNPIITNN